jgi:hypothetical protein
LGGDLGGKSMSVSGCSLRASRAVSLLLVPFHKMHESRAIYIYGV